jgi:hypothetical protein
MWMAVAAADQIKRVQHSSFFGGEIKTFGAHHVCDALLDEASHLFAGDFNKLTQVVQAWVGGWFIEGEDWCIFGATR